MKYSMNGIVDRWLASFLVVMCLSFGSLSLAEEKKVSVGEWITELKDKHAKLGGYIAKYVAEGEKGRVEGTLALHKESKIGALSVTVEENGKQTFDCKQWSTDNDKLYIIVDGKTKKITFPIKSIDTFSKQAEELMSNIYPDRGMKKADDSGSMFLPCFLLLGDAMHFTFTISTDEKTISWIDAVNDASVKEIDEESVTFETKEHGLLTISREHGLLLRQTVITKKGEVRVLELSNIVKNPEGEMVQHLSADWPTENAEEMAGENMIVGMQVTLGLKFFQEIIRINSEQNIDLNTFGPLLIENRKKIRDLVSPWIMEGPKSFQNGFDWAAAFKNSLKKLEDKAKKEGKELDHDQVVEWLSKPEVQEGLAGKMALDMMKLKPEVVKIVNKEMFRGQELRADQEKDIKLKDQLNQMLAYVYLEAIILQQIEKEYGLKKD